VRNRKKELEIIRSYFGEIAPKCSDEEANSDDECTMPKCSDEEANSDDECTMMDDETPCSDSDYDEFDLDGFGSLPYDEGADSVRAASTRRNTSNTPKAEQKKASSSSQSSTSVKKQRTSNNDSSNALEAQLLKRPGAAMIPKGKKGRVTGSQKATSSSSQQEVAAQMDNGNVSDEGPRQSKELRSDVNASSTAAVNPVEHQDCSGVNPLATSSSSSSPMAVDEDSDEDSPAGYSSHT